MNNIDQTLWNYIDGNCTTEEQLAVSLLIESDHTYRLKYQELLLLDKRFEEIELDEPPMAFTYNVIEAIRTEQSLIPLKSAFNKRIVLGIAAFFIFTLFGLLIFTITRLDWSLAGNLSVNIPVGLKVSIIKNYVNGPVLQGFLFFDTILALYLLDNYIRKKNFRNRINVSSK